MIALAGYFDDSGTHGAAHHVVVGGLIGSEDQWAACEESWAKLLIRPLPDKPGLKKFHLWDCRNADGEFLDYKEAERNHVTYLFRQAIVQAGLVPVSVAVDAKAWNEIVVGRAREELGTASELAFSRGVELAISVARREWPLPWRLGLFFDQGWALNGADEWARLFLEGPFRKPELDAITFARVSSLCGLQAADIIATETYWYCEAVSKGEAARAHFRDFVSDPRGYGGIFDRAAIQALVDRIVAPASPAQPS